jgi:4-coumarate--CoA ligase
MGVGALAAGGIITGANPMYGVDELTHQLTDSGASMVFTIPPFLDTVTQAAERAGCSKIIVLGDAPGTISFAALAACEDAEPTPAIDPGDLAALPYSSGTTGLAKGVMLSHANLVANVTQVNHVLPAANKTVLVFLPMFHIYGFTVLTLSGLNAGAKLITLPKFEPESFLRALSEHKVTNLAVVPPIMQFLAAHPMVDQYDLSHLERIGCGAAPLSAALEDTVAAKFGCSVSQGFGMTESSGVVALADVDRVKRGTCGEAIPGTELRIVDPETGLDQPQGSTGELWFRGPQRFQGYLNNDAATAETITGDGWAKTGDLGHIDEDGHLHVTDRLKELIKVSGYQVAPAELEGLLLTHPKVADAAVIGRPNERTGEEPIAYIVPREGFNAEEMKAWVAERVVAYKQIADVVIAEAIPKNPSGKILRRVLRDQAG